MEVELHNFYDESQAIDRIKLGLFLYSSPLEICFFLMKLLLITVWRTKVLKINTRRGNKFLLNGK